MTAEPHVHEWVDEYGIRTMADVHGLWWHDTVKWRSTSEGYALSAAQEILRLADLARPRDPRKELPADGQEVIYETVKGFRSLGFFQAWTDGVAEFGDGTAATWAPDMILCWWPAPVPPSGQPMTPAERYEALVERGEWTGAGAKEGR